MQNKLEECWNGETKVNLLSPADVKLNLPVTAVKCYLIKDNNILLVKDNKRGWDVPGGHVEKDESPENALIREMEEEAGCRIRNIILIGYLHCHQLKKNLKYPIDGLIAVYTVFDFEIDHSKRYLHEVYDSKFVPLNKVKSYHHNWTALKQFIAELVLNDKHLDYDEN